MKLVSWNVNGIRAIMKKDFLQSFEAIDADVLCLQETKAQDDQVMEALFELRGTHDIYVNSAERKGYSGTAMICKKAPNMVKSDIGIEEHDTEGRVLTADLGDYYLINVYVPNSGNGLARLDYRLDWNQALLNYMKDLEKEKPVILCGDLNVAHQAIDLANPKSNYNRTAGYTQKEIDGLSEYIDSGYIDSWRHQHPEEVKYSWWSYRMNARANNVGWRLDYFMVSEALLPRVQETDILNQFEGSDHCPVVCVVN